MSKNKTLAAALVKIRDQAREIAQLREDCACYEAMKTGVTLRISDLENDVARLQANLSAEQHRTAEQIRDKHRILNEYEVALRKAQTEQAEAIRVCGEAQTLCDQAIETRDKLQLQYAQLRAAAEKAASAAGCTWLDEQLELGAVLVALDSDAPLIHA